MMTKDDIGFMVLFFILTLAGLVTGAVTAFGVVFIIMAIARIF